MRGALRNGRKVIAMISGFKVVTAKIIEAIATRHTFIISTRLERKTILEAETKIAIFIKRTVRIRYTETIIRKR